MQIPNVRWMVQRDLDTVIDIERDCFSSHAWTCDDFTNCLGRRNIIGMVVELGREPAGFMIYELYKHYIHILNFAVHSDFRNKGCGSAMLDKLIEKLQPQRRHSLHAVISDRNLPAHLFFARHGFTATEVIRGRYLETDDDAYLFEYDCRNFIEDGGATRAMPNTTANGTRG